MICEPENIGGRVEKEKNFELKCNPNRAHFEILRIGYIGSKTLFPFFTC